MPITYDVQSLVSNFGVMHGPGESLEVYLYGTKYNGAQWLSDPAAALADVNTAYDLVEGLEYEEMVVQNVLNGVGAAMIFCPRNTRYENEKYIDYDDTNTIRNDLQVALGTGNAGSKLTYGDIVVGSSKANE